MFLRIALLVLKKDFAIELRSYEILSTTLFFAVSCVAIFSFAFVKEGEAPKDAAAGILWIAIAFAGTLALGRTFERERYGETLKALLLAPAPRPAIYVGKLLGILALLFATEAADRADGRVLLSRPVLRRSRCCLLALLGLGTIGYAAVGTLFAAMLVRARTRDVHAADPVVSDHDSGDYCGRSRNGGAAGVAGGPSRWRRCGSRCSGFSTSCSSRCRCGCSSR